MENERVHHTPNLPLPPVSNFFMVTKLPLSLPRKDNPKKLLLTHKKTSNLIIGFKIKIEENSKKIPNRFL